MSESLPTTPQELLDDTRWVRELARSLVGDRSTADDIAQESWLAALRKAPGGGISSPRAWFTRVLLNAAGRGTRRDTLRAERERGAARPEALPSTAELAERAEMQRVLAGAVLALEEQYRSTILWRYFGDSSSEEIAQRLGVPASTVRNRLRRGLELLRAALERRIGSDWNAPCLAFAARRVARSAGAASSAVHEGIMMGTQAKLALAVAVAVASVVLWTRWTPTSASEPIAAMLERADAPEPEPSHASTGAEVLPAETSDAKELGPPPVPAAEAAPARSNIDALADRLQSQVEASLLGQVDVAYFLELGLELTALEPGRMLPEPTHFGDPCFPLSGMPEGLRAEYQLRGVKNHSIFDDRVDSIRITADAPPGPYVVGGVRRKPPEVYLTLWRDHQGKVKNFGILTNLHSKERPLADAIATGALFSYDVDKPNEFYGDVGCVRSSGPGILRELPVSIVGGKWPDLDGLEKLDAGFRRVFHKVNR